MGFDEFMSKPYIDTSFLPDKKANCKRARRLNAKIIKAKQT
jgi:hypothetical protein